MNKKLLLIAGIAITSAGVYSSAMAVGAIGQSTARVVAAMTITPANALAFGDIISGVAGNVVITPAGGVTDTTVVSSGTQTAGSFAITGAASAIYVITLDASTTITDGTTTLNVTGLNHDGGLLGPDAGNGTLSNPAGTDTLSVGGQLTLTAVATAGSYTGTYNVSVDYQ